MGLEGLLEIVSLEVTTKSIRARIRFNIWRERIP